MAKKQGEYTSWLEDAFDDKKAAEELQKAQMSGTAKAGLLLAFVLVILLIIVASVLFFAFLGSGAM